MIQQIPFRRQGGVALFVSALLGAVLAVLASGLCNLPVVSAEESIEAAPGLTGETWPGTPGPSARPRAALAAAPAAVTPDGGCGGTVVFTKTDYADPLLPANQDCITPNVCITRGGNEGLYNAVTESGYVHWSSPADTEWAYGSAADYRRLYFEEWADAVDGYPPGMVGQNIVLHLISDDLYFDVTFTSWTSYNSGGGFAYTRTHYSTTSCSGLYVNKMVVPRTAGLGDTITYTLSFGNVGPGTAHGVVISDTIPATVTVTGVVSTGVVVTDTGAIPPYVWTVGDLAPGTGGVITITGSAALSPSAFLNTVVISGSGVSPAYDSDSAWVRAVGTPDGGCGGTVVFTKADYADPTLPANQDCITPNVCITRRENEGLYNAVTEGGYDYPSPAGTEWAYGSAADYRYLHFEPWRPAVNWQPPDMVGRNVVLHLIDDDLYFDVMFTSWTSHDSGGGFAYTRTHYPTTACSGLYVDKTVIPLAPVDPGDTITYTLSFGNVGPGTAHGVIISDTIPATVTVTSVVSTGVAITDTGAVPPYVWTVGDLAPGTGGVITITGSTSLSPSTFLNTAVISGSGVSPAYHSSSAWVRVVDTPDGGCGGTVVFTKADWSAYYLPINQDCITPDVCITRGDNRGLYNGINDYKYYSSSPTDTEWAYGSAADYQHLTFRPWRAAVGWYPPGMVGRNIVLHLINDDLYFDVMFTSWTSGDSGGGFAYTRTHYAPTACSGLYVNGSVAPHAVGPGDTITYTISFGNVGPGTAHGVVISDTIPPTVTVTGVVSTGVAITDTGAAPPYVWMVGDLAPGMGGVITITGSAAFSPSTFLNTAIISGSGVSPAYDSSSAWAQVVAPVGCGETVVFTRTDWSAYFLPFNQDCITPDVCIARGDYRGLYNAVTENGFVSSSPADTEWAFGSAVNYRSLSFQEWTDAVNWTPPDMVGQNIVLHLIGDDLYSDVMFTSWSQEEGGGFAYTRTCLCSAHLPAVMKKY